MSSTTSVHESIPVYDLLINDQFITHNDLDKIRDFSRRSGLSFIKIALTFGYISRKNYERSLLNAGYVIRSSDSVRDEAVEEDVLEKLDLKFITNFFALPLRIENNKVVTLMADPTDQEFLNFIYETYQLEPEIILASDLDIVWMSHKLLGTPYVKDAVFELMKSDPANSALITFSTGQLVFMFGSIAVVAILLFFSFTQTSIAINLLISLFFLVSILFKLFLALLGSRFELHQAVTREEVRKVVDDDLPIYTIQLPVYKEDKLIKKLIWNLQSIDYPR